MLSRNLEPPQRSILLYRLDALPEILLLTYITQISWFTFLLSLQEKKDMEKQKNNPFFYLALAISWLNVDGMRGPNDK